MALMRCYGSIDSTRHNVDDVNLDGAGGHCNLRDERVAHIIQQGYMLSFDLATLNAPCPL